MFITNVEELSAAADQLEDYLLIENPTDEEKLRYTALAMHMEAYNTYMMRQQIGQDTLH